MDQGNDAIQAREIWAAHRPTLLGPETSIFGLYAGPLWYYFISIGYFLTGGHPVGPVLLLIVLNVFLTFIIIRKVAREMSPGVGLLVGALLQISWWFYDSSRYAFNPFPDTFLGFMAIFCLVDFLKGEKKKYLYAAVFFGLFFHTDLASALAVNFFYFGFGLYSLTTKRLKTKDFFLANGIILFFLIPHFVSELTNDFSQTQTLIKELQNPNGAFANGQFSRLSKHIFMVVSRSIYRQIPEIGFLGFLVVTFLFIRKLVYKSVKPFTKYFVLLSICFLLTSWFFFATNSGWRDWQTSFLSPLIFVSVILAIVELKGFLLIPLMLLTIISHLNTFQKRYKQYLEPNDDPSLLVNEIKAIDWAYAQTENKSYSVYVWIPSIFDYHYQYLFWWYGRNKYGYFPCVVNTFPGSPKTYLPKDYDRYEKPKGDCPSKVRLLIMEPDENGQIDQAWYRDITQHASKVSGTNIGRLRLEKLILNP